MGTSNNNVIDLSALNKRKFDVNGKVLELDTSDLKIISRFESIYPTLWEEGQKIAEIQTLVEDSDNPDLAAVAEIFDNVDSAMRHAIDFIFDTNVCDVCIDHGSLFDPINGEYRFEHIINALLPLYETNLQEETKKIQRRVKKHTEKYVKK